MNTEGKANTKTGKKFALPPDAMFSQRALLALMFPLIIEQLLNSLMGTADTMMVSNVGSAAISAASLVDSINNLVLQVFTAMARLYAPSIWGARIIRRQTRAPDRCFSPRL